MREVSGRFAESCYTHRQFTEFGILFGALARARVVEFNHFKVAFEERGDLERVFVSVEFKTGTMWKLQWPEWPKQKPESSSSSTEVDFLDLCENTVGDIKVLVKTGHLLNLRQCQDLSSKVSKTVQNIRELLLYCGASVEVFRPAMKSLYRYMLKAEALLRNCAEKDWCAAAVFQCQNEYDFRDILLDVSLCYNAVYEHARGARDDWTNPPEDLRSSSVLVPAVESTVDGDKQDLQKRLNDHANGYTYFELFDPLKRWSGVEKRFLAKYLLMKMCHTGLEPQASVLDVYSPILWTKALEPSRTWGTPRFLGAGSGTIGVYSTEWLGIPCAKKDFHKDESDGIVLKEAGILAHLKHPCIVNFICCGNGLERGDRFIAMELMEKSLLDLIKEQKGVHFPPSIAIDMIVQMARGVRYLHDRGVAHRDLKPQNVVVKRLTLPHVEDHFCVKLVDFGISKIKVETFQSNTMTTQGIGTTMYRAPEANPGEERRVNWFKADAFSFGMTCAHLLSLKVPFEGLTPSELYKEVSKKGRRPELPDMYPKELMMLLKDCWKTDSNLRPSFLKICIRLETFKYGDEGVGVDKSASRLDLNYIEKVLEENSSKEHVLVEQDKTFASHVPIFLCMRGCTLELLHQSPNNYYGGFSICDICWEECHEEVYHCETCEFDLHPNCAEIKEKVEVFFHNHPLHLLIRNYYNDKLDTTCYICKESMQHSDWVYRCEQCDMDVHALCTKYPEEKMDEFWHPHSLNLTQYFAEKSLSCKCCNGEVKSNSWRYTCIIKLCAYDIHPHCTIMPGGPLCIFDASERLNLVSRQGGFHCNVCGSFGFSSYVYNCKKCNHDVHLECLNTTEDDDHWSEAYEEFILQHGTKENHITIHMILELLEKFLGNDLSNGSLLLTSNPTPVAEGSARRVEPTIQRLASSQTPNLDAIDFDDVDLRNKIAVETAERKAKRMTAKAGRLDSKAKYLKMLENLERIVLDLRSSESMLQGDGEVLDASLKKLKIRKHNVEDEMALLVQFRMRHGPRTCMFALDKRTVWELQTSLRADMEGVRVVFLCEEPGHQYVVDGSRSRGYKEALGEELVQKFQPLLGRGLEVVARAVSASQGQLTPLDCVALPVLGSKLIWDLRAIELEKHGKPWKEENVEALKRAEDVVAEWILSEHELEGWSVFEFRGLLRVRYKVTEEGDCLGYTRGSVAWLCKEHVQRGLEDGILESYPVKFYNPELN